MADETATPVPEPSTSTPDASASAAASSAPSAAEEQPTTDGGEQSVSPDSFGWDAWDGSAFDAFPEPVRPWLERAAGRLTAESQRTQKLLDELLSGGDDPRVAEFSGKYETAEKARAELEKKYTELESWLEKQEDERSDKEVDAYVAANPWLFEQGTEHAEAAAKALEAGWDWKVLHDLVKLQPAARKIADEAFKETKNAAFAIRLAKAESAPATAGAHTVVAGATTGAGARDVPVQPKSVARGSFRSAVESALDNAIKFPSRS